PTWGKGRWGIPRSPRRLASRRRIPRPSCKGAPSAMRVIPCLMLLLLASASAVQSQVRNAELGYSLALPEGFTEFPEARAQEDVVDAWSETAPAAANEALGLLIARMHGVLPREAMRQEDGPRK